MRKLFVRAASYAEIVRKVSKTLSDLGEGCKLLGQGLQKFSNFLVGLKSLA